MDSENYSTKIDSILSDNTKFSKLNSDPTEDIKKEFNNVIGTVNNKAKRTAFQKLIGHFESGYI